MVDVIFTIIFVISIVLSPVFVTITYYHYRHYLCYYHQWIGENDTQMGKGTERAIYMRTSSKAEYASR